jgi:adenosyl cobinamide kinase/adenosyl cobinamide phosphate guanylyltransferase
MNIILGLGIGVIGVLVLMGYITLEKKLNIIDKKMDKQKAYWQSLEYSIEIKSNRTSKEIQEGNNFLIDSIGTLASNVAAVGYDIKSSKESIEKTLEQNKEDINSYTKKQVTRIIYTVPMVKVMD